MRLSLAALLLALLVGVAPAADTASPKIEVGKPAPDITLPATHNKEKVTLSDYAKGAHPKNVVLFFFPKAMTGGCTAQCMAFRDLKDEFAKLDTVPIGISCDSLALQQKFTERDLLNFPLYADADKEVARAYGVLNSRGMADRVTFVIDKKGVVRKVIKVAIPKENAAQVLEYVKTNLTDR